MVAYAQTSKKSVNTGIPDDEDLIRETKRCIKLSKEQTQDWRYEAADLYDMVAGRQISQQDRSKMQRDDKVIVEFNLMAKFLDAVQGLQINNRQEIRYIPRKQGDVGVNEVLTGAAEWVRDGCDALTEESEAFLDCLISGMGVIETYVDMYSNPEGDICLGRRDSLEMYWDPHARRRNLLDQRWLARSRRMAQSEFEERWPDKMDSLYTSQAHDSPIFEGDEFLPAVHDATDAWKYEAGGRGVNMGYTANSGAPVMLTEYQWYKLSTQVEVATQHGKKVMTGRQAQRMQDMLDRNNVRYQTKKIRAKRWYRAFMAAGIVLEAGESPYQNGATYQFITGRRDRNQNTWYGVARALKDPQLWVDKFFSEILSVINKNAKGGIMAEEDAFADPARAEQDWARADSIVFTEPGALAGGKIQPKPPAPYPEGLDRLMQFTVNSLQGVTGLNLEFMGMADRMQPGVVESQRKESAISTLAWAFDSMRRYYIEHGRCLAYYIREYISDGRLARITNKDGQQYIPLVRDEMSFEFDVIVDEAPNSPNQRDRTWATLREILPLALQSGLPVPTETLDYLPLPSGFVQAWKKQIADAQQQQKPPDPATEADIALKQSQAKRLGDQTQIDQSKLQIEAAKVAQDKQNTFVQALGKHMDAASTQLDASFKKVDALHKLAQIPKLGAETRKLHAEADAQDVETSAVKRGMLKPGGGSNGKA